jgi:hypothetical protein
MDGTMKVWEPSKMPSVVDEFYFKDSPNYALLKKSPTNVHKKPTYA